MDTQVVDKGLLAIAARIGDLSDSWAENTVELGKAFIIARDSFPVRGDASNKNAKRPGWRGWIKQNTIWGYDHANRFILISEKFSERPVAGMSFRVLEYLSRGHVPEAALDEVVKRVESGEKISRERAKEIVNPHLPTRKEAIKQARETGKLVASRDGRMYSGASEDEMLAYSERRKIVYAIRRAVDEIAEVELTPNQWVNSAEDHWVHEFKLSHVEDAIDWLTKLVPLLSKRQKVVDNGTR